MLTKPKSKHLTVRIPEELREALDAAARADRRPVGNLVRLVGEARASCEGGAA